MKKVSLISLLICTALTSCAAKNTIPVASFQGKDILRNELIDWITFNGDPGENTFSDPDAMENYLGQMLLERAASLEYQSLKIKDDDVEKTFLLAADTVLAKKYLKNVVIPGWNREYPVYLTEDLFIKYGSFDIASMEKAARLAQDIVARTQSGKKLNDTEGLDASLSGYYTKQRIVFDDEEYIKAISALKAGEVTQKPLVTKEGIYVIRLTSVLKLDYHKLDEYAAKNNDLSFLKEKFAAKIAKDLVSLLETQPGVAYSPGGIDGAPNDAIFSIQGRRVSRAELDNLIDFYDRRYLDTTQKKSVPPDSKRRTSVARNVFEMELLKKEAILKQYDKDKTFLKEKNFLRDMIYSRTMWKIILRERVKLNDKIVYDEYLKNRDMRYSETVTVNGKLLKRPLPFQKVSEGIKILLQSEHEYAAYEGWKSELITKYVIKIFKKNLGK